MDIGHGELGTRDLEGRGDWVCAQKEGGMWKIDALLAYS